MPDITVSNRRPASPNERSTSNRFVATQSKSVPVAPSAMAVTRRRMSSNAVDMDDSSGPGLGTPDAPVDLLAMAPFYRNLTGRPAPRRYDRSVLARLDLRGVPAGDLRSRLPRPDQGGTAPVEAVREILAEVRKRGDEAVREYTERFDRAVIDDLRVPVADLRAALDAIPAALRDALEVAAGAIQDFHRGQVRPEGRYQRDGVVVRELRRAVDRAGVYVPGGRAGYPSTVLMTAVPARVAGVPEVALCVPPGPDGRVFTPTLAAAALAGVEEVYRIGGAQAVAALAYGTDSLPAVDVIVGPGNVYVALAKREVAGEGLVGVPGAFAGPSEVVVVADATVPAEWAAVDVVVQAEHGPDGLAWLVTWSEPVADAVTAAVARIVAASPRRADIEATLDGGGYVVLVDGPAQAIEVANAIAPEHLELMCADAESLLPLVRHAGAVFTGPWAPASVGDYLAGPSHVLPTFGSARFAGGLSVDDFVRTIHAISLDEAALASVAPAVATLAEAEGLAAHADSVRMRLRPEDRP
ncbi:MAG: histidinol dehydrogenase [Actinomycetota bacterium]|nr:histidinol dehydrogenase [Actinomycetota bacterium]